MDLLARNCLRACVCMSAFVLSLAFVTLCLSPCASWCFFYGPERNVCFCPHGSINTGLLIFLGGSNCLARRRNVGPCCGFWRGVRIALSDYSCWVFKHSHSCTHCHGVWESLPEHAGLQTVTCMLVSLWCCAGVTSASGHWRRLRLGLCGSGSALGPSVLSTSLSEAFSGKNDKFWGLLKWFSKPCTEISQSL